MAVKTPRQRGLFGGFEPPPRDPRGRKRIAWDSQVAETVALLATDSATQEEIAQAVGLSVKTLARIYAGELSQASSLIRRAVFAAQVREAAKGRTAAANFVLRELDRGEAEGVYRPRPAPVADRAAKLGKKEQRLADAQAAAGIFEPGPPPARLN